jgi:hypothetical protein
VGLVLVAGGLAGCGDGATTTPSGPSTPTSRGSSNTAPGVAPSGGSATAPAAGEGGPGATTSRGSAATPAAGAGGSGAATSGSRPAPSFTALANAVCRGEVADVPAVPDPGAKPEVGVRYVRSVERAASGLSSALGQLERHRPESRTTLDPLVRRARTVVATARSAASNDARRAADVQDDVRIAIARLNEASSAARLPACAL